MNKKTKFDLRKLLVILLFLIPVVGFILVVIGGMSSNDIVIYIGFAFFPFFGLVSIPYFVKKGINESNTLDKRYRNNISSLDRKFCKNENIDIYRSRVVFETIKNAVLNIFLVIIVMIILLFISGNFFVNDGPSRLRERSIISKILVKSRNIEGAEALIAFFILIFGIPILTYNLTIYIHKVRKVLKKEYKSYYAKVDFSDLKYRIHLEGKTEKYKHILDLYKCIGIRKKDIINKDVIIVNCLDKTYIFPVNKNN